jgi:hypothetical protein
MFLSKENENKSGQKGRTKRDVDAAELSSMFRADGIFSVPERRKLKNFSGLEGGQSWMGDCVPRINVAVGSASDPLT